MVFGIALKDIVEDTKDLFGKDDVIIRMGLYRGTRIDEKDGEFSWSRWVDQKMIRSIFIGLKRSVF